MKKVIVIMSGGFGERFWPKSRQATPKQTIPITSDQPMLVEAVERAKGLIPENQIFISTGKDLERPFRKILEDYDVQYLIEPMRRDTAAAIGYSSMFLAEKFGRNTLVAFVGADYLIPDATAFQQHLEAAFEVARRDNVIVTLGIEPTRPATGYGYIHRGLKLPDPMDGFEAYEVKGFKEKPNEDLAEEYLDTGEFYWNSGMFITKLSVILHEIKTYIPKQYFGLETMAKAKFDEKTVIDEFEKFDKISIDYAIMEKTELIAVLKSDFAWDDMGDWEAISRSSKHDAFGNVVKGSHTGIKTKECVIYNDSDRLIATVGVSEMIIVQTDDAILICPKTQAQNVKKLVRKLKSHKETEKYL